MTEEGFRKKFHETRPEQSKAAYQYVPKLQRYSNRWTEIARCRKDFDDSAHLLTRKQFVNTCLTELALFLRERLLKDMGEMMKLAERYLEAHEITYWNVRSQ